MNCMDLIKEDIYLKYILIYKNHILVILVQIIGFQNEYYFLINIYTFIKIDLF